MIDIQDCIVFLLPMAVVYEEEQNQWFQLKSLFFKLYRRLYLYFMYCILKNLIFSFWSIYFRIYCSDAVNKKELFIVVQILPHIVNKCSWGLGELLCQHLIHTFDLHNSAIQVQNDFQYYFSNTDCFISVHCCNSDISIHQYMHFCTHALHSELFLSPSRNPSNRRRGSNRHQIDIS